MEKESLLCWIVLFVVETHIMSIYRLVWGEAFFFMVQYRVWNCGLNLVALRMWLFHSFLNPDSSDLSSGCWWNFQYYRNEFVFRKWPLCMEPFYSPGSISWSIRQDRSIVSITHSLKHLWFFCIYSTMEQSACYLYTFVTWKETLFLWA